MSLSAMSDDASDQNEKSQIVVVGGGRIAPRLAEEFAVTSAEDHDQGLAVTEDSGMNPMTVWNAIAHMSNGQHRKPPVKRQKDERPKEVVDKIKSKAQAKRERRAKRNLQNDAMAKSEQYAGHPEKSK